MEKRTRIAILGYGNLGAYLFQQLNSDEYWQDKATVVYLWNRTPEALPALQQANCVFSSSAELSTELQTVNPDLIIECAHPEVNLQILEHCLNFSSYMPTSLTAFKDATLWKLFQSQNPDQENKIIIPSGAAWGLSDLNRMRSIFPEAKLQVDMIFPFDGIRTSMLEMRNKIDVFAKQKYFLQATLHEGSVTEMANFFPQNANTMMAYAMVFGSLDSKHVWARMVMSKDDRKHELHCKFIHTDGFAVDVRRSNPAAKGNVTGNFTFVSFLGSLKLAFENNFASVQY